MLSLAEVDRVRVTTVVDNYIDVLRQDEKVARRFSPFVARQMPDLRAEHGLAHYVEVTRGESTVRIAFDFGPSETALTHNFRVLGLDPGAIDALALSHGHWDHFGGLGGFLRTYRRAMKKDLTFYGGEDHFLTRWTQRGADRVCLGRLHRDEIERYDVRVESVRAPLLIADGVLLSGEMHEQEAFEPIPDNLRVERDGAVVPDSFIGEQTLITHVKGRGLVILTNAVNGMLMTEIARAFDAEYGTNLTPPRMEKRAILAHADSLDAYIGRYLLTATPDSVFLEIRRDGTTLYGKNSQTRLERPLIPQAMDSFFDRETGSDWIFERNPTSRRAEALLRVVGTQRTRTVRLN